MQNISGVKSYIKLEMVISIKRSVRVRVLVIDIYRRRVRNNILILFDI